MFILRNEENLDFVLEKKKIKKEDNDIFFDLEESKEYTTEKDFNIFDR